MILLDWQKEMKLFLVIGLLCYWSSFTESGEINFPNSIQRLLSSDQPRIGCFMVSPEDITHMCEKYSTLYADKPRDTGLDIVAITCSKNSKISKSITASIALMKLLGSCNWVNIYIQWVSYWARYQTTNNNGISSMPSPEDFDRLKRRIEDFENEAWLPQLGRRSVEMSGLHLRLAAITVPPLVIFRKNTFEIEGGTFREIFSTVGNYYNFTNEINVQRFKEQGQGRKFPNGSWTGTIGGFIRKEFDATFMGHQVSRYPYLHHTTPLFFDEAIFVVSQPTVHISFTALINPLTPLVWFFNFLTLSAEVLLSYIILTVKIKMGKEHRQTKWNLIFTAWDVPFSICVEQGPDIPKSLIKLVILWSMAWMIIISGYKDKLLATLTFPELNFVPTKVRDLKEHPEYRLLLDGFLISFRLNHSSSPDIQPLKPRLELHNPKAVNSIKCVMAATIQENTVCMGFKPMIMMAIATNTTINQDYSTTVMSENMLHHVAVSIGLQKHSMISPDFERITGSYKEAHLYEKSKYAVINDHRKKGIEWLNTGNTQLRDHLQTKMEAQTQGVIKLTYKHLLVVYVFYCVCIPITAIVFGMELYFGRDQGSQPARAHSTTSTTSKTSKTSNQEQEQKVQETDELTQSSQVFSYTSVFANYGYEEPIVTIEE
ncbi:unnamed protein product [Allacma fusca]|uniref:Uncharacterized protein n=1 Tax=Allacma fusca TaxID=39272 RepID=A0A8J2L897_9HEXA|nr:unnamed protein product [Allacma fusca]